MWPRLFSFSSSLSFSKLKKEQIKAYVCEPRYRIFPSDSCQKCGSFIQPRSQTSSMTAALSFLDYTFTAFAPGTICRGKIMWRLVFRSKQAKEKFHRRLGFGLSTPDRVERECLEKELFIKAKFMTLICHEVRNYHSHC